MSERDGRGIHQTGLRGQRQCLGAARKRRKVDGLRIKQRCTLAPITQRWRGKRSVHLETMHVRIAVRGRTVESVTRS